MVLSIIGSIILLAIVISGCIISILMVKKSINSGSPDWAVGGIIVLILIFIFFGGMAYDLLSSGAIQ